MCIVSKGSQCSCQPRASGSGIALVLVLIVAVWWLLRGITVGLVLFALWLSGQQYRTRTVRTYSRPVHAAGRTTLAGLVAAGLIWPVWVGLAVGVATPVLVTVAIVNRRRVRRLELVRVAHQIASDPRPSIRVHAVSGWPERRHGQPSRAPRNHAWYGGKSE